MAKILLVATAWKEGVHSESAFVSRRGWRSDREDIRARGPDKLRREAESLRASGCAAGRAEQYTPRGGKQYKPQGSSRCGTSTNYQIFVTDLATVLKVSRKIYNIQEN